MDAEQFRRRNSGHLVRDRRTPIAALRHKLRVAKPLHQHDPGTCDTDRIPAGGGRLARKSVAGHRRDHQMESVRRAAAMRRGIGQGIDDLQLLDDRARPAVGDDEGQRIVMLRANVNEVNIQTVDLGDELRQGVQPRLDLPPVVIGLPIAHELLQGRQRHPWESSSTVSFSGHRVAARRRRRSTRSSSGTLIRNGRISSFVAADAGRRETGWQQLLQPGPLRRRPGAGACRG